MKLQGLALACYIFFSLQIKAQSPQLVVPVGHNAWITSYSISPDEKYMATGAYDNLVKIWDFKSNQELVNLVGHKDVVGSLCFSKDNKMVASGSWDGEVKIWSLKTKQQIAAYKHYDKINSLAFSPDGKYVASVANDSLLFIYSIKEDSIVGGANITGIGLKIKYTPDGKYILLLDDNISEGTNTVWFFDVKKNEANEDLSISYLHGNIYDFDLLNGGQLVGSVVATDSGQIRIYSLQAKKDIARFNGHATVPEAIVDAGEKNVFFTEEVRKAPGDDNLVTVTIIKKWNAATRSCLDSIVLPTRVTEAHGFKYAAAAKKMVVPSRSSNYLVLKALPLQVIDSSKSITALCNNIIQAPGQQWLLANDKGFVMKGQVKPVPELKLLYSNRVNAPVHVKLSKDSSSLIILDLGVNRGIKKLDLQSNVLSDLITSDTLIENFAIDADNKYIAYTYGDRSLMRSYKGVRIIELATRRTIIDTTFFIGALLWNEYFFSENADQLIISHNWSDSILIWNFKNSEIRYLVDKRFRSAPTSLRLLRNNRLLTSYHGMNGLYVWDLKSLKVIDSLESGENKPSVSSYDPERGTIFMEMQDGSVKLMDDQHFRKGYATAAVNTNISQSGYVSHEPMIYTYSLDNLIRFWNLASKKPAYIFIPVDSANFIVLDKDCYYYASTQAARQLYYVTEKDQVITFEQLDVKYNRPDKVLQAIGSTDTALIRSFRKAWEKRIRKLGIDTTAFRPGFTVPAFDFMNRDLIKTEQRTQKITLRIKGGDSTYKLDRFNVWVNETPLYGQRGISLRNRKRNNFDSTITLELSEGENRIETSITNVNGTESYRMPLLVNYSPADSQKAKTWFIGIGIDEFVQSKYNLKYSTKDIRDLSKKLQEKYKDIIIDTLFNEDVTAVKIKALKQKLLQTSVNDKVIVSYSGHGMLSKDFDYFLSTYGVNFDKPEENGLPYDELESLLDSIPARKKLMLIDACHSGEVDKDDLVAMNATDNKLIKGLKPVAYKKDGQLGLKNSFELMQSLFVNVGKSTGATIISAAAGTQFALEGVNNLLNGVFTYCILEAMNKPNMKISELKKIVGERVVEITKGLQKPTSRNETIAVDWEIW